MERSGTFGQSKRMADKPINSKQVQDDLRWNTNDGKLRRWQVQQQCQRSGKTMTASMK
jgi:hypothetical protein